MRPPGYEPGELPTAPLRDINQRGIPHLRVQRYYFFLNPANFPVFFLVISNKRRNFAHDTTNVQ